MNNNNGLEQFSLHNIHTQSENINAVLCNSGFSALSRTFCCDSEWVEISYLHSNLSLKSVKQKSNRSVIFGLYPQSDLRIIFGLFEDLNSRALDGSSQLARTRTQGK